MTKNAGFLPRGFLGPPNSPRLLPGMILDGLACVRVEEQMATITFIPVTAEVEHVPLRAGNGVVGPVTDLTGASIVLDKPQDRAVINQGVIDEIPLGERRDDQERYPWA